MNTKKSPFDCTVVVLSFNTQHITDVCLKKAETSAKYCQQKLKNRVEILVVDNGSSDGTLAMIKTKHTKVRCIALSTNVGVAQGYNKGMKASKTPFILLINSDLYLNKNTLWKSLTYMETHPTTDVMMCRMVSSDGTFTPYGGHLPTPMNTILWQLGFESIPFVKHFIKRIYRYNNDVYAKDSILEWAPTAFLLLKKNVYDVTRGHDEKMFLYMEDVEWCKRIHDKGFFLTFTPSITTTHIGGASTAKKINFGYLLQKQIEGLKYYHKKHFPHAYPLTSTVITFGLMIRALFYFLLREQEKSFAYSEVFLSQLSKSSHNELI